MTGSTDESEKQLCMGNTTFIELLVFEVCVMAGAVALSSLVRGRHRRS